MKVTTTENRLIIISSFTLFIILFIYFGFYIGLMPLPRTWERKIAAYNTVYVDTFSWEKTDRVKKGMTPQEVVAILGEPYQGMPENPSCPTWSYGNPDPWKRFPPLANDFWWFTAQVCFDPKTNTVSSPKVQNMFFN